MPIHILMNSVYILIRKNIAVASQVPLKMILKNN